MLKLLKSLKLLNNKTAHVEQLSFAESRKKRIISRKNDVKKDEQIRISAEMSRKNLFAEFSSKNVKLSNKPFSKKELKSVKK